MAVMFSLFFLLLSFVGTALAAYPYQPYYNRDAIPVNQPPTYLVYPHGVYKLANETSHVHEHDFIFGVRSPRDQLLLHSNVYKRPGIWSSYATKEITFPPPGSPMRVNITQVVAHDRGANNTGGFVKLIRGGVGRENVTLLFRSQRNRPINFGLDVYGVPKR